MQWLVSTLIPRIMPRIPRGSRTSRGPSAAAARSQPSIHLPRGVNVGDKNRWLGLQEAGLWREEFVVGGDCASSDHADARSARAVKGGVKVADVMIGAH